LSDREVEEKFRSLAQGLLGETQTKLLLGRLWRLEEIEDIGEIIRLTRI
jgi:hypothetical protein